MSRVSLSPAIAAAIAAALLFGASTPIVKQLLHDAPPILLAGLLYLGSGIGLGLLRTVRDRGWRAPSMTAKEWLWLLLAIGFGGVLGPVALLLGLTRTSAASASLLLNLEAVLTALLAWIVFRENADRRIVLGMGLIVAGAVVLVIPDAAHEASMGWGALLVAGACLCWALDNNFTRKVSASDALFIAGLKGLVAGVVNMGIALMLGARWPAMPFVGMAMTVGLLGYGISLVLLGCGHRDPGVRRPRITHVLAGCGVDGCRRVVAPNRTPRAPAYPRAAHAYASPRARRTSPTRARCRMGRARAAHA
jgi:drug/metabolite transporter (DMT)-like permease